MACSGSATDKKARQEDGQMIKPAPPAISLVSLPSLYISHPDDGHGTRVVKAA
jgi:hypothetical protein